MSGLALITGASSGIGAAFALALAERKYDLIIVARRLDRLRELARSLEQKHSVTVEPLTADLTRDEDLARVEQRIASAARLELLINNAGFGSRGKFFETDPRRPGADAPAACAGHDSADARGAGRGWLSARKGGIINVSSVAGFWQAPGNVSYCATKCWMNSFTEGLALELAESVRRSGPGAVPRLHALGIPRCRRAQSRADRGGHVDER